MSEIDWSRYPLTAGSNLVRQRTVSTSNTYRSGGILSADEADCSYPFPAEIELSRYRSGRGQKRSKKIGKRKEGNVQAQELRREGSDPGI